MIGQSLITWQKGVLLLANLRKSESLRVPHYPTLALSYRLQNSPMMIVHVSKHSYVWYYSTRTMLLSCICTTKMCNVLLSLNYAKFASRKRAFINFQPDLCFSVQWPTRSEKVHNMRSPMEIFLYSFVRPLLSLHMHGERWECDVIAYDVTQWCRKLWRHISSSWGQMCCKMT